MPKNKRIAFTPGEPGGVGPELSYHLAFYHSPKQGPDCQLVVIANRDLIRERIGVYGKDVTLRDYDPDDSSPAPEGTLIIYDVPLCEQAVPGKASPRNAPYVLRCLDIAHDNCMNGNFAAMVTGPVSKGTIEECGIKFTGHTEYLQEKCGAGEVVMVLGCREINVALATTHLPLRKVSDAITRERLRSVITILDSELRSKFGIAKPVIYISGLNPHAGENGHLGTEEQEVIIPVVEELRERGLNLVGPLPADTMFTPCTLKQADAFLAMYHDQGLPVMKYIGFDHGYNVTLGLPYIRTSVDHGVALDLAGTAGADHGSLYAAVDLACCMAQHAR